MPTYQVTHELQMTMTHQVVAETPDEANGIAVEMSLELTRELEQRYKGLTFGPLDDRARGEPREIPAS